MNKPFAGNERLAELLRQAQARVDAMSPAEREKHFFRQQKNYVLAEAEMGSDADEAAFAAASAAKDLTQLSKLKEAGERRRMRARAYLESGTKVI